MLWCLQQKPPQAPPHEGPASLHLGAASEEEGPDLGPGVLLSQTGRLPLGPSRLAWPPEAYSVSSRQSQGGRPSFALKVAWEKGLPLLPAVTPGSQQAPVGKRCFLALPLRTLESVHSPAAPAKGLTLRSPACCFPACCLGSLATLRSGKWHQNTGRWAGVLAPCWQAHSAPQALTRGRCLWTTVCAGYPQNQSQGCGQDREPVPKGETGLRTPEWIITQAGSGSRLPMGHGGQRHKSSDRVKR